MTRIETAEADEAIFADIKGRNTSDYLLRTATQHHHRMSAMADAKANIIITVSSIVLTLSLGKTNDPELQPSLLTLTVFTLIALLLAVLAVLPKFRSYRDNGQPLPNFFNILFFGHFGALSREDFYRELSHALTQDKAVYATLARDLYALGVYMERHKYRYLRWSYVFFLAGFVLAALEQVVRFAFH